MDRPIEIWQQVDDLLQTLTGYPKIFDDVDFKPPPPPPPPTFDFVFTGEAPRGIDTPPHLQGNITRDPDSTAGDRRTSR